MNVNKFREIIKQREYVEEISHGEWADGIEECQKQEVDILSEDIGSTIEFLKNDCSASEYAWISEIFEDVIERVPSTELVQCYKDLMHKYPKEYSTYNIAFSVEAAEAILRWEEEHGEKS